MSASCYTRRISVQTQARNAKVQYPGGRAVYNPISATCATNPDFSVLKYVPVSLRCSLPIVPCPPIPECVVFSCSILNGGFSTVTSGCLFDGGSSLDEYQTILEGGTSGNNCGCNPSNCDVLNAGNSSSVSYSCLFDGGSSSDGYTNTLLGGTSIQVCN